MPEVIGGEGERQQERKTLARVQRQLKLGHKAATHRGMNEVTLRVCWRIDAP